MRRPRASVPACQAGLHRGPCLGPGRTIRRYGRPSFTPGDTCFRFDPASALRLGFRWPGERAAWAHRLFVSTAGEKAGCPLGGHASALQGRSATIK
jgi:hypothetical protein